MRGPARTRSAAAREATFPRATLVRLLLGAGLERGDAPLEEGLSLFEEGVAMIREAAFEDGTSDYLALLMQHERMFNPLLGQLVQDDHAEAQP